MRIIILALFSVLALASTAQANQFDSPGAACIPSDSAITNSLYLLANGNVEHQSGQTATISMYCPIPLEISPPGTLELTYLSNENSSTTYVSAQYIKLNMTTGATTVIATATSQSGINDGTVRVVSRTFADTYDFQSYVYWVRVDIRRRTTSQWAWFYRVTVH